MKAPTLDDSVATAHMQSEWRRGWPAILASTIGFGSAFSLFMMSAGLFIAPMREEFGWSMSQAAFAPIVSLLTSLMMPLGGIVIDKLGARRVAIFGLVLFSSAYVALALFPLSLPLLYFVAACLGFLGWSGNSGPYTRVVATWFQKNIGSAFGVTLSGTSVTGMTVVPVVALVIERFGWRAGYIAAATIVITISLPCVLWLFRGNPAVARPGAAKSREQSGQTWRETLVDARFWLLMLSLGFAALPMGAFLVHLQPLLRSQDFTLAVAAGYGGLFSMAIGIGRIGGGLLIDRFWDFGVATALTALAVFGSLAITSLSPEDSSWAVAMAVCAIGLSYGAEVDFGAYFTLKLFGLRDFSKIFGFKSLVVGGGVAIGGMLSSALFDLTGGYEMLGPVAGLLFLLAALTMLLIGVRQKRLQAASVPAAQC